jgi:hypothetical protein
VSTEALPLQRSLVKKVTKQAIVQSEHLDHVIAVAGERHQSLSRSAVSPQEIQNYPVRFVCCLDGEAVPCVL